MIKKLPKSKIEIEIAVSWDVWKDYLDQAAAEVSEELKISGFRPGKAPRNLVEQKVGSGVILNNAAEKAVKKSYVDFVTKEKLEVIGTPKVEIEEIEEGKELKYKAEVAVMPEVKVKEDYKKEVKKINEDFSQKKPEVPEEELSLELEKLANSRVKLVTVMREARKGDSVEVDFEVKVGGVIIENGASKNHPLVLGKGVFIPGFEENIVGMREGDEKEFELNFPEDYHKKDLAGKPAVFKMKLNLVQERQTPEVNDDFAKSLGSFENLEALKKNIREGMEHEQEHKLKDDKRGAHIEEVIKATEVDLPEVLLDEEAERMFGEFSMQLQPMGITLEQYLEKLGKKKEDLRKDWQPQAEKRVISALALKEIAKMEEIDVTSKEVEEEINKTLQHYKNVKDIEKNIDMERLYQYSKNVLENEKAFEMLDKI